MITIYQLTTAVKSYFIKSYSIAIRQLAHRDRFGPVQSSAYNSKIDF